MTIDRLLSLRNTLSRFQFHYANEDELQRGIAAALESADMAYLREYQLTPQDRLDFLVDDLAIEVKIGSSAAAVLRQIARYAQHEKIAGILLVTARGHHALPESFAGKPVLVHSLLDGAF